MALQRADRSPLPAASPLGWRLLGPAPRAWWPAGGRWGSSRRRNARIWPGYSTRTSTRDTSCGSRPRARRTVSGRTERLVGANAAGAVLGWLPQVRQEQLRRLQVRAHASESPVFFVRAAATQHGPSPAPLRVMARVGSGEGSLSEAANTSSKNSMRPSAAGAGWIKSARTTRSAGYRFHSGRTISTTLS
jgi:hypothetical protein